MKNKQPAGLSCRPSWAGVAVFLVLFSIAMAYAEHTASTEFLKGYHGSGNPLSTRFGLAAFDDLVAVTVGTKHRNEYHDALLLKPSAAWHTYG
jgi:hypothetical protein